MLKDVSTLELGSCWRTWAGLRAQLECLWEATGLQPNSGEVPEPEGQVSAAVTWQVQCPINSGYSSALHTKRMSAYSFKLQCHKTAKKTEF